MGLCWRSLPLAATLATVGVRGAAAQRGRELGVLGIATASDPVLAGAGPYAALRTSARTRVATALALGASDRAVAWRGELVAHFLLDPLTTTGSGFYLGAGAALVGGPVERGYLVLLVGLEGRPGGRSGWAVEAGVGGGARLAAGYRWRRFRSGPSPEP